MGLLDHALGEDGPFLEQKEAQRRDHHGETACSYNDHQLLEGGQFRRI